MGLMVCTTFLEDTSNHIDCNNIYLLSEFKTEEKTLIRSNVKKVYFVKYFDVEICVYIYLFP